MNEKYNRAIESIEEARLLAEGLSQFLFLMAEKAADKSQHTSYEQLQILASSAKDTRAKLSEAYALLEESAAK